MNAERTLNGRNLAENAEGMNTEWTNFERNAQGTVEAMER